MIGGACVVLAAVALAEFARHHAPRTQVAAAPPVSGIDSSPNALSESLAPAADSPVPASSSTLENSSAAPSVDSPAAASSAAPQLKHVVHPHPSSKPALAKKGNERYGRFE
jgi:hypothetical protein